MLTFVLYEIVFMYNNAAFLSKMRLPIMQANFNISISRFFEWWLQKMVGNFNIALFR